MMRTIGLTLLLLLAACSAEVRPNAHQAAAARAPVTVLISIDGFRPAYLGKGDTPALDALAAEGSSGTLRPSFPTLTFPNHQALVTGLTPDHSGIVANTMFDPQRPDVKFTIGDAKVATDPFWWQQAEPLWITAQRAGINASIMFWPGSEAAHGDVRPLDWQRYDANVSNDQRVRTVVDWMRRPPEIRPRLVLLYFDIVDKIAHKQGPDAPATLAAVRAVDAGVAGLRAQLAALHQPANLVIVSDHGMRAIDPAKATDLDTIVPRDAYRIASWGPFATIDPAEGRAAEVEKALLAPHPFATCRRKGDLPGRFAYGRNPRVAAIVCLAAPGGEILQGLPTDKGDHGYDPDDPEMAALFIASGPSVRVGSLIAAVPNVEVYPLVARLAGLTPRPSDARGVLADVLVVPPPR